MTVLQHQQCNLERAIPSCQLSHRLAKPLQPLPHPIGHPLQRLKPVEDRGVPQHHDGLIFVHRYRLTARAPGLANRLQAPVALQRRESEIPAQNRGQGGPMALQPGKGVTKLLCAGILGPARERVLDRGFFRSKG